jgi:hypothetical protein
MLGVELIDLPVHQRDNGALVALDRNQHLPFAVQRVFVILACPTTATRAEHSSSTHQAILAVQGTVVIDLDNGREQDTLILDSLDRAVCIHAGVWLRLRDFSPSTIVLVAASKLYADTEYFAGPNPGFLPSLGALSWS